MSTGYTLPILIGGRLDDGEWSWSDGSFFDEAFVMAHSWDQLGSGTNACSQQTRTVGSARLLSHLPSCSITPHVGLDAFVDCTVLTENVCMRM